MGHWRDFLRPSGEVGRFMRWKEVAHATGLSRTTAWRLQKRNEFPAPYAISPGRVGYSESEIEAWRASRTLRAPLEAPAPQTSRAAPPVAKVCSGPPPQPAAARAPVPPAEPVTSRRQRRRSEHARAIAQQIMLDF